MLQEDVEQPSEATAVIDKYKEEDQQQDPLSLLISSSQIVLSGNEDYYASHRDKGEVSGNPGSYNSTAVLYIPCMNGNADNNYGTYCILGIPIDRTGNSAFVDNIQQQLLIVLENMTSRPVGIALLNSSLHAATSSSSSFPYSSSSSPSRVSEQRPYALNQEARPQMLFSIIVRMTC